MSSRRRGGENLGETVPGDVKFESTQTILLVSAQQGNDGNLHSSQTEVEFYFITRSLFSSSQIQSSCRSNWESESTLGGTLVHPPWLHPSCCVHPPCCTHPGCTHPAAPTPAAPTLLQPPCCTHPSCTHPAAPTLLYPPCCTHPCCTHPAAPTLLHPPRTELRPPPINLLASRHKAPASRPPSARSENDRH